ncbi:MAG: hypothetical protein IT539_14790 [Bradyrhizobiaceae bacterium]|nr:hypothetical protein [Bradyrhizobiaceae bacterium]
MAEKKHVFIVASPRPRTGKTMLARLIAEYLTLAGETRKLFDTDVIDHKLASYFPTQVTIVDLERVPDQMKLFDSLASPVPMSQVIDLSHRSFAKFFNLMRDFDYVAEAKQAGFHPVILFIPDTSADAYEQGVAILQRFRDAGFVLVRNLALGEPSREKLQEGSFDILHSRKPHVVMPRLDPFTLSAVEDPRLSLSDFMRRAAAPDALGPIPPVQMSIAYLSLEARKATLHWLRTMFDELRRAIRDVDLQADIVAHDRFGA